MKTLAEIKEFATKSCKIRGYTYKNETIPFMDGFFEGFQKAVEEYEKLINNKEDERQIEIYK
jgi:hypothetical protein